MNDMPCDCPDDRPARPVGPCHYLAYSGGPLCRFYRLVERAIPDVELAHGCPTVHIDGSLEFGGPPPVLTGYRQDGRRLVPNWPPCVLRMLRVQVVDTILQIDGICGDPHAALFSGEVSPEQCSDCPTRQGSL